MKRFLIKAKGFSVVPKNLLLKIVKVQKEKERKVGLEFLKRLLELHSSGMPIADAVKLLNQRLSDPGQKEIAGVLWKELAEGRTLSAMRNLPEYFSESSSFVIEGLEKPQAMYLQF